MRTIALTRRAFALAALLTACGPAAGTLAAHLRAALPRPERHQLRRPAPPGGRGGRRRWRQDGRLHPARGGRRPRRARLPHLIPSPSAAYAWTDITYLLHQAGVSWGYYVADGSQAGTLPAVSWVVPTYALSEHPPASIRAGQAYVTGLINWGEGRFTTETQKSMLARSGGLFSPWSPARSGC